LQQLDSATSLADLTLPGNRLERYAAIDKDCIAFGLMNDGEFASAGNRVTRTTLRSSIIVEECIRARKELLAELHPGRTIREDVLNPLGLSVNTLANELHTPATRLSDIIRGRRGVTADTALRLARYLGTSATFWLNLQSIYELKLAEKHNGPMIRKQVSPRRAA
jgi:antitoxin HigA-1